MYIRKRERRGKTLSEERIFILQVTILNYKNSHKDLPKCYIMKKKGEMHAGTAKLSSLPYSGP